MSILHRADSLNALLPVYASRFRCIGSDCTESCCSGGWDITIDQKTFEIYQKGVPAALKSLFDNSIERRTTSPSREHYANVKHNQATAACPFLDERLCVIHRDMGDDLLSNTCFNYPRYLKSIQGQVEQVLTLSCPEAARLALLTADAFDFIDETIPVRSDSVTVIKEKWGLSLEQMNEIRIFCFQLMRTEGLQTWEKLAVLGNFCSQLDALLKTPHYQNISTLIDGLLATIESGEVLDMLAAIQPDHNFQAQLLYTVWKTRREQSRSRSHQAEQDAVAKGLGLDAQTVSVASEVLLENYRLGLKRLPDALVATPDLMDNYILNEMFRDFFPFGAESVYENYIGLVFRFGMLRFMLSARCADGGELPGSDQLLKTVVVFCRIYQYASLNSLFNLALKEVGWENMNHIYGLLPG